MNSGTPLRAAAFERHEGAVELLWEQEDVGQNPLDENDHALLGPVAIEGKAEMVKLLLGWEDVKPDRPDC